jgi:hypothetical protein
MNVYRIMLAVLLLVSVFCLSGCFGPQTPRDALNGYDIDWTHLRYIHHPLDKPITDDVQAFIQSKQIPQSDISEGENAVGGHVVMITQEIPASRGMETNEYILYYDNHNVRTQVRTFHSRRSC